MRDLTLKELAIPSFRQDEQEVECLHTVDGGKVAITAFENL